jgi:hypothetical protein
MGLPQPAVETAATEALVSARQHPVRLEAMAESEETVGLLATAVSEELAATARLETTEWRELILVIQARTVKLEVREEWAAQAALADRFQVMAVPEVMQGWVAPEVPVEMEPLVPMVWPQVDLLLPAAAMEALAEMARPVAMAVLVEWEVRLSMVWPAQTEPMAMEAMGAHQAAAVLVALAAMARAEFLFQVPTVWARAEEMAELLDSQALAVRPGELGPSQVRMEILVTAEPVGTVATAEI